MPDILKGTIKDSNGNSLYPITSIDNVINLQTALDGKASSTHVHGNITNDGKLNGGANKVVVTDGNKFISVSTISTTELGYLSGVTSNIQTQLDNKLAKDTSTTTYDKAYVKLANGTQSSFNIAGSAVAYSLIFRDGDGRAKVANPSANNDIANKNYVDTKLPKIVRG